MSQSKAHDRRADYACRQRVPGTETRILRFPIDTPMALWRSIRAVQQYGTPKEKRAVAKAVAKRYPAVARNNTFVQQWSKDTDTSR